jgi:hypothetical protein
MAGVMAERLSPDWWRDRLLEQHTHDRRVRDEMLRVYNGVHPHPTALTKRYAEQYLSLIRASRTPWGRMIVDTTAERLEFQGFRVGDGEPDGELWSLFKRASVDQHQRNIYRDSLATGTTYVSVWPTSDGSGVSIMPESPLNVCHELEAGTTDTVAAAVKVWPDEVNQIWRCTLYLPDRVVEYQSKYIESDVVPWTAQWSEIRSMTNPFGQVPIVPFLCRRDTAGYGRSELIDLLPLFDRVELITADMLVASSFGAFRQRWATGLEIPIDPTTGKEVEPFRAALDRLWISEDTETRFGSFDSTDMTPYIRAKDAVVAEIAAISRVPSSYFVQSELANPPSAQALEAAEANLISKVRERQMGYGRAWEQVVSLVLLASGDRRASESDIEVIWKDPRTRSESQVLDAASKMKAIGFPFDSIAEFVGYSPSEIARLRAQKVADALVAGLQPTVMDPVPVQARQPAQFDEPGDGDASTT